MNYNKELAIEFDNIGIKYELNAIPEHKKGTIKDYNDLETKLYVKSKENERMLVESELNSDSLAIY